LGAPKKKQAGGIAEHEKARNDEKQQNQDSEYPSFDAPGSTAGMITRASTKTMTTIGNNVSSAKTRLIEKHAITPLAARLCWARLSTNYVFIYLVGKF